MIKKITRKFYPFITWLYDPLITVKIGSQKIKAPMSHPLKGIMESLQQFGFNITRLVKYTHQYYPDLKVIDIGANIGDTAAFVNNYKDLPVLCIDGDPAYFELLTSNVKKFSKTTCCLSLVGPTDALQNKILVRDKGTAYLNETKNAIKFRSLQNIVDEFELFSDAGFLKIDTDGFDTSILKGSSGFLTLQRPVIFFEYDPGLITNQGEDPLEIFDYLQACGYEYLLIYQNIGDYFISLSLSSDKDKCIDLANYYMGRNTHLYADICAFPKKDKELFETARNGELAYFAQLRKFKL